MTNITKYDIILVSRGEGCADTKVDNGKQKLHLKKLFQKKFRKPLDKSLKKWYNISVLKGQNKIKCPLSKVEERGTLCPTPKRK